MDGERAGARGDWLTTERQRRRTRSIHQHSVGGSATSVAGHGPLLKEGAILLLRGALSCFGRCLRACRSHALFTVFYVRI